MTSLETTTRVPHLRRGDLLAEDVDKLRAGFISAWDIETSGLNFRADRIGTVQICDETGDTWVVQIDPAHRPDALCFVLSEASPKKLFHFAPFDLAFMRHHWGVRSQNVACTKILDRLVHPTATSHSLKDVLERELGVSLPKDPQIRRSDWAVERLSPAQLDYAVADVTYLVPLYDVLMEKATQRGVSRLAERSFDYLPVRVETEMLGLGDLFDY